MRTGWFRDAPRGEDDLCPNCCTPWKCNGPHLDEYQVIDLRSSAFAAIRRAAALARKEDARYALLMEGAKRGDKVAESLLLGSRLYAIGLRTAIRAAIGSEKS